MKRCLVFFLVALAIWAVAGPLHGAAAAPDDVPAVQTTAGWVRGIQAGATYAYLGVPFAAPPLGDLRWRPPLDPQPWNGERPAQAYPPRCPQLGDSGVTGNEDCLYLNIWTPTTAIAGGSLPVMVFIHGGGNSQGSTSEVVEGVQTYDGQLLAERGGVVVVTLQYRLGALGFLYHPALAGESPQGSAGNYALLDQVKALEWVQANVAAFGGDPGRVLLFGESAGGLDTCLLLVSPLAHGLFSSALVESGGCLAKSVAERTAEGLQFTSAAGCGGAPDPLLCLRSAPTATLVTAMSASPIQGGLVQMPFGATVERYVLPQEPMGALAAGHFNHVPFVIGANANEMQPFVPYLTQSAYEAAVHALLDPYGPPWADQALALYPVGIGSGKYLLPQLAFAALASDAQFICPARRIARAVATAQAEPVYRYFFTHSLSAYPYNLAGAFHGLELLFVFQHLGGNPQYQPTPADLSLESAMLGYWTRFAASGDPNGGGALAWPVYLAQTDPYLELGQPIQAGAGVRTAQCNFWDQLPTQRVFLPLMYK